MLRLRLACMSEATRLTTARLALWTSRYRGNAPPFGRSALPVLPNQKSLCNAGQNDRLVATRNLLIFLVAGVCNNGHYSILALPFDGIILDPKP